MDTNEKFWMVQRVKGRPARVRHKTREAAEIEAKRLAAAIPGKKFFVMESVALFRCDPAVDVAPVAAELVAA